MKEKELLARFLPDAAIEKVMSSVVKHNIHLIISKNRKTKLGDYRPPIRHPNHRISINHNLNKYAFLITYVHELAHLKVYEQYKNKVAPHGHEWKLAFKTLMMDFISPDIFPDDLLEELKRSVKNSKASSFSDLRLSRLLHQYDVKNGYEHVEDLPVDTLFETQNGKHFLKGEKLRTRYKCVNVTNKKTYLFHPLTPVVRVN